MPCRPCRPARASRPRRSTACRPCCSSCCASSEARPWPSRWTRRKPLFDTLSFDDYKAGRPSTPSALSAQFGRLQQLLEALAVPAYRCPGFEADDVLATLAKRARDTRVPALVVSGDRDLLQLARGSVQVHFVGRRGKDALVYDEAAVFARFGVAAEFLPSYVALVGDPSDNLPGVPGIGAITAQRLLLGKRNCQELLDGPREREKRSPA